MAVDGKLVRGEFADTDRRAATTVVRRRGVARSCGGARWPRCVPRSSRSAPPPTRGSCPRGSRSGPWIRDVRRRRAAAVIDQLAGVPMPASAIEPLVFGPRVRDYSPAMLDELLAAGEVTWSGAGSISGSDGWIAFHPTDSAPLTLAAAAEIEFTDTHRAILDTLAGGGAYFFRQLPGASPKPAQSRAVGTDLGRLDHRRHVRPCARCWRRGHPRRSDPPIAGATAAAGPLQRAMPRPAPPTRPSQADGRGAVQPARPGRAGRSGCCGSRTWRSAAPSASRSACCSGRAACRRWSATTSPTRSGPARRT